MILETPLAPKLLLATKIQPLEVIKVFFRRSDPKKVGNDEHPRNNVLDEIRVKKS